jgi:hypothetical protein
VNRVFDQPVHFLFVGHLRTECHTRDLGGEAPSTLLTGSVVHAYAGSLAGKGADHCASKAARTSGYEHALAV